MRIPFVSIWGEKLQTRPVGSEWEWIGRISYGKCDIPNWIIQEIDRIGKDPKTPGNSLGGMVYFVNGRTFKYRLDFAGQGGSIVDVSRKLRRSRKN